MGFMKWLLLVERLILSSTRPDLCGIARKCPSLKLLWQVIWRSYKDLNTVFLLHRSLTTVLVSATKTMTSYLVNQPNKPMTTNPQKEDPPRTHPGSLTPVVERPESLDTSGPKASATQSPTYTP